jgi:molybdopterin-synthase adenylyltransferase
MDDELLLRYSRQIMLPQIDVEGQQKLLDARVLIFGLGGLGSPVAMYLAASGVGSLMLCDPDEVDITNLQRQLLHADARIGMPKVDSAVYTLSGINPGVALEILNQAYTGKALEELVNRADVVVDATDNLQSRLEINRACVQTKTPLVSAAAIRWEGQISVYDFRDPLSPCYHCLYGDRNEVEQTCSENGVMAPVVGILGSMQAVEVIKLLTATGQLLVGRLLFLDALSMQCQSVQIRKNPDCSICGTSH